MPLVLPARPSVAARLREPVTRHTLVGTAGSLVLAFGALGVGYLPARAGTGTNGFVDTLRANAVGSGLAKVAVIAGTLLLLRAWLTLGQDVRDGRITGTARLTRIFWLWAVPLVLVPPLFSQDVYSYAAQGNLLNVGYDPYHFGAASIPSSYLTPVGTMWLDTPAPYGPSFLYLGKLAAEVCGNHVFLAVLFMRAFALFGVYLIIRYLPRLARVCGVDAPLAVWAAVLNPLVLIHFVSGAHNDALMLGLVVAGLTLALEGRPIVGALVIVLGGTVKAPALLALGFVGLAWAAQLDGRVDSRRRTRILTWLALGGLALAVFLVINALTGLDFGWVAALTTPGMVRTLLSPVTALGLLVGWIASTAGLGTHTSEYLSIVRGAAEACLFALFTWWMLRRRAITPAVGAGAALLLLATFGPVLQAWYVLWGIVVLAATALGLRGIPYLRAGVTTLVVYGVAQPVATASPIVRLPDWFISALAVAVGLTMLLRDPVVRAEIADASRRLRTRTRARLPRTVLLPEGPAVPDLATTLATVAEEPTSA